MAGLFNDVNPIQSVNTNQNGINTGKISRGSLISFSYPASHAQKTNVIHDPYPMLIISDIWPRYIRGVNLHYLTFPYIKRLLNSFGNSPAFSYSNIKPDRYIASAFRTYVRTGIRQPKSLDTGFLLDVLGSVRSFSPNELEKIRQDIQSQIQSRLQAKAAELSSYEQQRNTLHTNNAFGDPNSGSQPITGRNPLQPPNPATPGENEPNSPDGIE